MNQLTTKINQIYSQVKGRMSCHGGGVRGLVETEDESCELAKSW